MKYFLSIIILLMSSFEYVLSAEGLGELQQKGDLTGEWLFVVGENDTFLMSKTGRFTISSGSGGLQVTDLWKEQGVTFKEMNERAEQYPVSEIVTKTKFKPLRLGSQKAKAKYSIFLKVGDDSSIKFYKEALPELIAHGTDIFGIPGADTGMFYRYACGDDEWKKEILMGNNVVPEMKDCNQAKLNRTGSQVFAITNILGIKRVPFAVINKTNVGAVVNYNVFKGLSGYE
jgi:hypothetical protein